MFDMAVVNLWLLYKRDANSLGTARKDTLQLASFKIQVAFALIKANKPNNGMKRGRPNSAKEDVKIKTRSAVVLNSIRYDQVSHFPVIEDKRNRCKNGNCTGRTNVACKKCNVNLCLSKDEKCFVKFYNK